MAKKIYKKYQPTGWQLDQTQLETESVQYWHNGVMVTAQMKLDDAKQLVASGAAFVITSQAIGAMVNGYSEA